MDYFNLSNSFEYDILERILQFKVLNSKYSASDIMKFTRGFQVVKGETRYINTTQSSDFIIDLVKITDLPLTNYFLTEREIKRIFSYNI